MEINQFSPRFLSAPQMAELVELYHLARVKHSNRHDRMILACKWFQDKYPEVKGGHKDLSALVNNYSF